MKKTQSLQSQLNILLAIIVAFQSLALVLLLIVSNVFNMLDAESVRVFTNTTKTRATTINDTIADTVNRVTSDTKDFSEELIILSNEKNIKPEEFYRDNDIYSIVASKAGDKIVKILEENKVTGAFFILNGSNSNKENDLAHSAVYIRNLTPDNQNNQLLELQIGPTIISNNSKITTGIRWKLDMVTEPTEDFSYYMKPIWASEQYNNSDLLRFGYWNEPIDILKDNQKVITYTVPLLDQYGNSYGIMGFEIDTDYFSEYYLPKTDLLYNNSFYMVSELENNTYNLDWFISNGTMSKIYLEQGKPLILTNSLGTELYKSSVDKKDVVVCTVEDLKLYNNNSPFSEKNWTLSCFVKRNILRENMDRVRNTLLVSILIASIIVQMAVVFIVRFYTRKISGLSKYVRSLSPLDEIHFKETGMREIDDLTLAIKLFNESLLQTSKTTSKILELSLLPIGGYEILNDSKYVIITDFLYKLLNIKIGENVSKVQWYVYYNTLTKHKLEEYDDIYRYYNIYEKKEYCLRIIETESKGRITGVVLDQTKEIKENLRLVNQLDYDALTGLYSQIALRRIVTKEIIDKPEEVGAMIFIDLDNLKYVNDNFGHSSGDALIIKASQIFKFFEQYGGIISRISGDEFAIYMHGYESKERLYEIIKMLYPYSENFSLITPDGNSNKIRFSTGVAWYPEDAKNVTELLKLADFAMYEAKHKNKGSLFQFNLSYYSQMSYMLENREAINRLLDEKLIRFDFQPIIDLKTGEIYAYEALMRSILSNFKNPHEILTVAAAQSKLVQLEHLVFTKALEYIEENEQIIGDRKMFVNSIPNVFIDIEHFINENSKYQKYFDKIVIEIIETESTDDINLLKKINRLRDRGTQVAIDDFGSGYSNEIRIIRLMPDVIKIDMELIQGIHKNIDQQSLVANIVDFCHKKNIKIVAEGIEIMEDLEKVKEMGIDFGQGFYIGMPEKNLKDIDNSIRNKFTKN